jgi:hypothetical protein
MSGGPTVNLDGEVVGVNSFGIAGETQPFNFVRPAAQLAELLAGAGVDNEVSETTTAYRDGLQAYWDGDKADAVAKLSTVVDEQPSNALAADYLDQTEALPEPVAEESDSSGAPVLLIVAGGVALMVVAGGVLALVLVRRGRKTPPAPPYPPTVQQAGPVPVAPPPAPAPVPVGSAGPAPAPPVPTPTAGSHEHHFCGHCGEPIEHDAQFCTNCGHHVD